MITNCTTNLNHEKDIMEKILDTIGWKAKGVIRPSMSVQKWVAVSKIRENPLERWENVDKEKGEGLFDMQNTTCRVALKNDSGMLDKLWESCLTKAEAEWDIRSNTKIPK